MNLIKGHTMGTSRVNRNFGKTAKVRMIVSVELRVVEKIDQLVSTPDGHTAAQGNRSEFVRLAIEEKMQRECA